MTLTSGGTRAYDKEQRKFACAEGFWGRLMFENSIIVFQQILVMFFIMMLGYYIFRKGVFRNETTRGVSELLNRYVMPCVLLRAFQQPYDAALMRAFLLTVACAAVSAVFSMVLARAVYRTGWSESYADQRVCTVMSNDGFMALPLLSAMFGAGGVFLGSAHICCMVVVLWSYGIYELSHGREKITLRSIFLRNPGMLATIGGLILFASPVKLPGVLYTAIDLVGDLNTPLAMICLGCFLAQVELKQCFLDPSLWILSALRLLVIPLICMAALLFVPLGPEAKLTLLVGIAAPCAIAPATVGQICGADYLYTTRAIALSTLLSVITLPALIAVMETWMRLAAG